MSTEGNHDQDHAAAGAGSPTLKRPPQCSLFDDETWALLCEKAQRQIIAIYNTEIKFSDEYRRFLNETVIGTDEDGDSAKGGGVRSIRPWRLFSDPDAQRKLLKMGNDHHRESQRKELEALRRGQRFAPGSL